jgi:hypothetical protein
MKKTEVDFTYTCRKRYTPEGKDTFRGERFKYEEICFECAAGRNGIAITTKGMHEGFCRYCGAIKGIIKLGNYKWLNHDFSHIK